MQIKYIIDYKGYGSIYILTNVRTGEVIDITKEQAEDYLGTSDTSFSIRADVSLRSEPQVEVKRPLGYSYR